jgi:hypothetical protein
MPPRTVTVLRPQAVGTLCVATLVACAAPAAAHHAATARTPVASAAQSFTPFPTPSATPPFTPPPHGLTPPPAGVVEGRPPVTFVTPAGYSIDLSTPQEVVLTSNSGAESLSFSIDPSIEDLSHPLGTVVIGGATGVITENGVTGFGYREDAVVSHGGVQYEAVCTGYSGYDTGRLTTGCRAFLASIAFTG